MKRLIVFKGKPGVGKTTIASAIAKKINCPIIHKDDINNLIFSKIGANQTASELAYDLIFYLINSLFQDKNLETIIVDCSLSKKSNYFNFKKISQTRKAKLITIEIFLENQQKLNNRLNKRKDLPSHRIKKIEDIQKQGLLYENYSTDNTIKINSDQSLQKAVKDIIDHLKK